MVFMASTTATAADKRRPPLTASHTTANSTPVGSSGVLLGAAASEAERRERETMNLKLEISHLRERLLLRVGGDTTAAELEAENFALKASLLDAQEAHARTQKTLQTLDAKYAKALSNLVKMDHAWKSSVTDAKQARAELAAASQKHQQLERQLRDQDANRQTLSDYQEVKIRQLETQLHTETAAAAAQRDQREQLTLKMRELESELAAVRAQQQRAAKTSTVPRAELDAVQTQLQQAKEETAALRGETNALRTERSALQTQLGDTKASLTAAMAKFLQLKEDNATLTVRVAAAHEASEQGARDAAFFKGEVDRIQRELTSKEHDMLQLERRAQVLERRLAQQQTLAETAKTSRDHAAKRLELQHELSWKDREFALENEVRALKQQCAETQCELDAVRQQQAELRDLLQDDTTASTSADQDLKTLVMEARARRNEALLAAQQHQKTAARLEKELAKVKSQADDHAALQAELDKTRRAMERIVGRKAKAAANAQRTSTPPSAATTTASAHRAGTPPSTASTATVSSRISTSFVRSFMGRGGDATSTSATKRKLDLADRPATSPTPSSLFSPSKKRLVHVTSRYMQPLKR